MHARSGFSLVELAIVIVVIGLLVGGVLVGADLLKASAIRAVINEHHMFTTAVNDFKLKYGALPGDMKNATSFWGDNATYCADAAITDGSPGTCNGDGDGEIDVASAATTTGEMFQLWNQLSYAGFIGGYFDGIAGSGGTNHCVLGTNCPRSKFEAGGWGLRFLGGLYAGSANVFAAEYGNYFVFGGQTATQLPHTAVLTPGDAYSIDKKVDDGMPGTGEVLAYYRAACANSTSVTDYASTYQVTDNTPQCSIYFRRQF